MLPIHADKSLKYGVGLALALTALIGMWSWRTLRHPTVMPPLPPIQVSGSAHPISVVTAYSVPGSGETAPETSATTLATSTDDAQEARAATQVAAPQAQTPAPRAAALSAKEGSKALAIPAEPAAEPDQHSLVNSILTTVVSLL